MRGKVKFPSTETSIKKPINQREFGVVELSQALKAFHLSLVLVVVAGKEGGKRQKGLSTVPLFALE